MRVRDESIALTHKRVGAPLYGPTTRCWSDQSPNAVSWRAWLNRPTAGAGWLTGLTEYPGTVPAFLTRNRGQSPPVGWRNACFVSVADGRFDREIERVERFCPVVKAHFAALYVIHRGWRFDYLWLMDWIPPESRCGLRPERDDGQPGTVPARWGFFCFPAPKGQNEIAQGKAKRPPGLVDAWISAPLSSAPSGRDSISTFEPTGRCPGLSPCAPLGQKASNRGQSPRDSVAFIHKQVGAPFYGPTRHQP